MTRLFVTSLLLAFCTACPKDAQPSPEKAGANASIAERVVFNGAPGFSGGRGCTDVRAEDGCDSQWQHVSGQVVRVFVIPVKDPSALDVFVDKLAADVSSKGGVVDRFSQKDLTLVRFLQAMPGLASDGGRPTDAELATINYALVGRDQRAVHLITSIVPFSDQQAADARIRELLGFALWTQER